MLIQMRFENVFESPSVGLSWRVRVHNLTVRTTFSSEAPGYIWRNPAGQAHMSARSILIPL